MTKNISRFTLTVVTGIASALLILGWLVGPGLAAPSDLPPRPTPRIPPPIVLPNGGKIILQTLFDADWSTTGLHWQSLYTVVQWQDQWDDWHDVAGWRGSLDEVTANGNEVKGLKTWWVPAELFGKGMFRWQVYTSQNGVLLVNSAEFSLPERKGQSVVVEVALTP